MKLKLLRWLARWIWQNRIGPRVLRAEAAQKEILKAEAARRRNALDRLAGQLKREIKGKD